MDGKQPTRGEVWFIDLNPVRGHEQAGKRPALIVSVDLFNNGPAGLVVVLPITTKGKGIPFHTEIFPPEGGLKEKSFIKCEDIRSISKERLISQVGKVSSLTMAAVEDRVRILLNL
ncbi:type II toxin-antitoxin system PemK/MazF family toxin [Pelotomaculum isophthalicicum JI]|uniref:mRNA interferase n=1 Tax=Pelotomaculum isophthalicicum JI TaxID=947010 RepID=A0A9X4H2D8_9FIRM|nr:type II toxin-antitoxin system PemK/MazF family toxin [Pelotomaculum isophthalicicum]MDF9408826.1 type II toxin-antitoxin system PemK/MazF family toxin [Pelotomaculum isophthalicicum JI]